eukprot:GHVT01020481.1.p2 GENE.GHVT01020481.1~~GHVT01020481.1.p2  ORF type:complete len:136 (+),score=32.61 GHVT01020481.1:1334-1741(+)
MKLMSDKASRQSRRRAVLGLLAIDSRKSKSTTRSLLNTCASSSSFTPASSSFSSSFSFFSSFSFPLPSPYLPPPPPSSPLRLLPSLIHALCALWLCSISKLIIQSAPRVSGSFAKSAGVLSSSATAASSAARVCR